MIKRFLLIFALAALVLPATALASATDEVKVTVDEVVKIVSNKELKKPQNVQKRRQELKSAIGRIFDYGEMAKRSLAQNWRPLTPAQRSEFVQLFATLLENSYAGKIESYNNEKIVYTKESVEGDTAEVRSKVLTTKRDEYALDYRMMKEGGRWMVYDVVIEGVSLVSNYRGQFSRIIHSQGYPELVKRLKTKGEESSLK